MKKRIIPLILLLAMLLSLSAYAASPRVMTILPAISFDGTTANCRVSVSADRSTDQISAVIQLWNGSTRIARWTDSGTGYLLFSNSATVSKGKTYELTVDVKINGVSKPQVSIEGTCKFLYNFIYLLIFAAFSGLLASFTLSLSFLYKKSKLFLFIPVFATLQLFRVYDSDLFSRSIEGGQTYAAQIFSNICGRCKGETTFIC